MKNRTIAIAVLIVLLAVSGCAAIGRNKDFRPFEEKTLVQVKPGQTTATEITKWFGPPAQVIKLVNGNAYVYSRSLSKATGIWLILVSFINYDTHYDRVVFFLNANDVVTHYGSSFDANEAAHGM